MKAESEVSPPAVFRELTGKRLLLLQGPAGPFFRRLADHLRSRGCQVTKVNFNAGEDLYYRGREVVHFTGSADAWPDFFESLTKEKVIEGVVVFGDCRPLHRAAIERARSLGLAVYVFEEGYLRPDFVTIERNGVNGYSELPKDPEFYRALSPTKLPPTKPVPHAFVKSAVHTICYAATAALFASRYPNYRHHRDIRPLHQARLWAESSVRRVINTVRDRAFEKELESGSLPPFFFVPLQVHLDSQMRHCRFESIEAFISEVVTSFAKYAPDDTSLVLKHHPMDRAYRDYGECIRSLRDRFALGERLLYVDVIPLPATLRAALGTVVINSTLGLSSIHHGTPVKCLGSAVYDMPGLTYQGSLDDFFKDPGSVDRSLYQRFRYFLRLQNQINGSVWSDLHL